VGWLSNKYMKSLKKEEEEEEPQAGPLGGILGKYIVI
jgi:hypothetical protein